MTLELTEDGFAAINQKIAETQDKLSRGLLEPGLALQIIRDARVDLYALAQLLKAKVVITQTEPSGSGVSPIGA